MPHLNVGDLQGAGFRTVYGRGLLGRLVEDLDRPYLVVAHPEPWQRLKPTLGRQPELVVPATDLSSGRLEALLGRMPAVEAVIGIGGATAIDTAKWLNWRCGLPLYQMPSLPTVNAPFISSIRVSRGGRSSYEGEAVPERVLVDFGLMWAAPPALVRAGIGDILGCHTALHDWALAELAGAAPAVDPDVAGLVALCLEEVARFGPDLAAGRDDGLRRLMECHRVLGCCRDRLGHGRFEEGSEHWFASAFEAVTGRTVMHGELVTLGVLVMAAIQGNDPELPRRLADGAGMRTELGALGISWSEVAAALHRLPDWVEEHGFDRSVANGLVVDDTVLDLARTALRVTT